MGEAHEAGPLRGRRRVPRGHDPLGGRRVGAGRGGARQALEAQGHRDPAALRRPAARGLHARGAEALRAHRSEVPLGGERRRGVRLRRARARLFRARAHAAGGGRRGPRAALAPDVLLQARQGALPGRARGEPARPRSPAPRRSASSRSRSTPGRGARRGPRARAARGEAGHAALQARQDEPRVARARRGGDAARACRRRACSPRPARLPGPEDFFLRRFAFEFFPRGTGFPELSPRSRRPAALPSRTSPPSPSTMRRPPRSTTRSRCERSRAASCAWACTSRRPRSGSRAAMRSKRSRASACRTVYFPGGKITMLPPDAVEHATLAAGPARARRLALPHGRRREPSPSRAPSRASSGSRVADNLRIAELDTRLNEESVAAGKVEGAHGEELFALWRLARSLKVAARRRRGAQRPSRLQHPRRRRARVDRAAPARTRPWTRSWPSS